MEHYNAVVIGSGPAGHTCAVRLAQLGARVAVIERDYVGGICTNWGCTPSKSMIESAKIARVVREAALTAAPVASCAASCSPIVSFRSRLVASIASRILPGSVVPALLIAAQSTPIAS